MRASFGLGAGLACVALAGCGNGLPEVEAVQQNVVLQSFDDCEGLEQYLEDRAVLDMRARLLIQAEIDRNGGIGFPFGMANDAAPTLAGGKESVPQPGPIDYTRTNTQVAGVDEADFVKNDGTHILVLSGTTLYVNRSWPANQLETLSKVTIEGWPREMFLDEQRRVVVFSQTYREFSWYSEQDRCKGGAGFQCDHYLSNTLKLTVLDLTDDRNPQTVREEYLPGTYLSSRRVGASVRVVTSDPFRWPAGIQLYPSGMSDLVRQDKALRVKAYESLMDANEQLIRAQTLEQWLPPGERRFADGTTTEVRYSCREFSRPTGPTELGLLTVATLDLADSSAPVVRSSIVARADEVYASETSLYVANQHWWWWPAPRQEAWTYVHKFDLTNPQQATYVASGAVIGTIVDQFSMDEHNGYLRVATNLTKRVEDASLWSGRLVWTSRVAVLGQVGSALQMVGSTPDLADEERLYSSRFVGDRGFLVTYHEVIRTDPLFTLDLSDPANPTVVGQLEVPGYSTYLHPLDENHLLAIGVTDSNAVKLSLYDVTDFAHPRSAFEAQVGTFSGSSEAQVDHKAFNYFPAKKLLAIPFYSWSGYEEFVSDIRVFKVDVQTGITQIGALPMTDLFQRNGVSYYGWDWRWSPSVRRSVMADDFVYGISDAGIRSANVNALGTPLATLLFDPPVY